MPSLLPPPPPSPSPPNLNPTTISPTFSRIPSWLSLSSSSPSPTTTPNARLANLHLLSLTNHHTLTDARHFLTSMDASRIPIKTHLYTPLFAACSTLHDVRFFHRHLLNRISGRNPDGPIGDSLIKAYFGCGSVADARNVFDEMPVKSLASWSLMVSSCARGGFLREAVGLFSEMRLVGVVPDEIVIAGLLHWCSEVELGRQLHSYAIRTGSVEVATIVQAIGGMYVKCGCLESSEAVLDGVPEKNVVSWTGLMAGYVEAGREAEALVVFDRLVRDNVELDQFVFSVALKACSRLEEWDAGRQIHGYAVKLGMDSDVSVGTPVVDFYVKCGKMDDAQAAFDMISEPNEISWSSIVTGYAQVGRFEECLAMFKDLRSRAAVLNSNIYTSLFQVSSFLADSSSGRQLHADAIKRGLLSNLHGCSALVTLYSKSGDLASARCAFELIAQPDTIAWTAIITGCAYHGRALEALEHYNKMQNCGVKPNSITYIGVLTGCSHAGLVSEARECLDSMRRNHGVEPTIDHYNCMLDVYCRAGRLDDAFELIESGHFAPNAMSWKILLSGCTTHSNIELGKIASEKFLKMEPVDTAGYVLTFNMYASAGRWEEAASVRQMMNVKGIRKEVSCSWITVEGKVHRFIVGDRYHPSTDEIYAKLDQLETSVGFPMSTDPTNDYPNSLHKVRMEQLLDHSEKLAIAFGLISLTSNCPIVIFKNLRVCGDCHSFTKMVSKVTGREIVVRDSTRFHHFKGGLCSCNDFW